jgi:hypothetical protein
MVLLIIKGHPVLHVLIVWPIVVSVVGRTLMMVVRVWGSIATPGIMMLAH